MSVNFVLHGGRAPKIYVKAYVRLIIQLDRHASLVYNSSVHVSPLDGERTATRCQ
jgi:hypothetical protein